MKRSLRSALSIVLIAGGLQTIWPTLAFAATTYSFTSAGATGQNGPTQAQVTTAYTATSLASAVTVSTQGIQQWTVPTSGSYQITAVGAGGGGAAGGNGASITGTFALTSGTVLKIVVGQTGAVATNGNSRYGGGGGSYVTNSSNTAYVVAGGGGGAAITGGTYAPAYGTDGSTVANPASSSGGVAGTGSGGCGGQGQGGGGLTGNGTGVPTAMSFTNNSVGGGGGSDQCPGSIGGTPYGGFGGGGAGGNGGGGGGGYYGGTGGDNTSTAGQYDSGDGGGSYNNGASQSNVVASNRNTNGSVTITLLGPSLTSFAPTTTLTNSSSLSYNIVFSQSVTGLATNDFSLSGTGSSTCTIGSPSGSGASYTLGLSGCSPGTVILTIAANAVQNSDPQYAPSTNTTAATVIIDQTAPGISSVAAPANKTYVPSETPTFTVNFSESVTISNTPRFILTVGSLTRYANYISMTDSKTALFRYTVSTSNGEFDIDGISMLTSMDLSGGAITDLAGNNINPSTFTAPTLTSVLVAQPAGAPTITGISATTTQLSVAFTAGAANGSTTSTYQYSTNNGSTWNNRASGTTASPLIITGLTDGTGYTVRIRAVTNAGNSDSSTAVTETPTAVSVTGDSTLLITYGNSGSTGAYSASGGTGSYTWSLGSSISGVTLSGTTVTASASTAAGTYTQTVRATDGNSQVGTKTLTITVNKAATSISIALPNSATSAAASGTVTITATVPRAGAVNFKIDGSTISGCGAAAAASTTATCSWTAPGTLGSVTLTAVFTPTDSSNYETATTTNFNVTIVNGVSTISLSLTGGVTQTPKGQAINIIASIDQAGRVTFLVDGKRIPGCYNVSASAGNKSCSWKPTVQSTVTITATLNPTSNVYQNASSSMKVLVTRRTGYR